MSAQQDAPGGGPTWRSGGGGPKWRGGPAKFAVVVALPIFVVIALVSALAVIAHAKSGGQSSPRAAPSMPAAQNRSVDPGTPLPGNIAPGFTLTDQFGHQVSLRQFRGKAVVLAFVDSRCTTVCPLTTVSMTQAVRMLGPAAAGKVQLLGIDANPDATAVADVHAYSAAHQMMRSWHFLTGTHAQLAAVWRAYHVYVAASHGSIDHEPAIYLIDPNGRERTLYLTQMAYATIGEQADLLADGISKLLPGHPTPHHVVPLTVTTPIKPAQAVRLPVIGGTGQATRIALGPGHPHLLVFLASWLTDVSNLPSELRLLSRYEHEAVSRGWPTVVAVDESQTETNSHTLPALLAGAGGTALGYPVVADASGRVADGYGVRDMPWIEITSSAGKVLYRHDGWLSATALAAAAARAAK